MAPKEKKISGASKQNEVNVSRRSWAMAYGDCLLSVAAFSLVGIAAVAWQGAGNAVSGRLNQLKSQEKMAQFQDESRRLSSALNEKSLAIDALSKQIGERDQQIAQSAAMIEELQKKLTSGKRGATRGRPGKKRK